jgi:hypothetical protein
VFDFAMKLDPRKRGRPYDEAALTVNRKWSPAAARSSLGSARRRPHSLANRGSLASEGFGSSPCYLGRRPMRPAQPQSSRIPKKERLFIVLEDIVVLQLADAGFRVRPTAASDQGTVGKLTISIASAWKPRSVQGIKDLQKPGRQVR